MSVFAVPSCNVFFLRRAYTLCEVTFLSAQSRSALKGPLNVHFNLTGIASRSGEMEVVIQVTAVLFVG